MKEHILLRMMKENQILYLFEEEDDAIRYAMMLEDEDYPEMNVIEVEDEVDD